MQPNHFTIKLVNWAEAEQPLSLIRRQVFIEEQQVPEALEWDEFDQQASHLLAIDQHAQPIGCARLLSDGHIGRMAVLAPWRGKGVGSALLSAAIELARRQGHRRVALAAQCHAIPFYQRAGFTPVGAEFMDAGIPHRLMQLTLNSYP